MAQVTVKPPPAPDDVQAGTRGRDASPFAGGPSVPISGGLVVLVLGLVGLTVVVGRTVPALGRLRSHGSAGASPSSVATWFAVSCVWLCYQVSDHLWAAVPGQVVASTTVGVMVALLHRRGLLTVRAVASAVGTLVAYVLVAVAGASRGSATEWVGAALVLGTLAYGAPALMTGLRSLDLSGVSVAAVATTQADAVIGMLVGTAYCNPAYAASGALLTACTAPVLVRVVRVRGRAAQEAIWLSGAAVPVGEAWSTSERWRSTTGSTSPTETGRLSSAVSDVVPASRMPQGTMASYQPRSQSQLRAKPWVVTPRDTRTPIAAILRSGPRSSAGTQTPLRPETRAVRRPRSPQARTRTSSRRRT